MRKNVFLFILILSIFQVFCFSSFRNPSFSPNGKYMLLTGEDKAGVYLYDVSTGDLVKVTDGKSSGYWYNWAPDGKRFGFKTLIERGDGRFLQVPSVYDMERGVVVPLTEPVGRAGVPSFSNDGKTAFTVGETLILLDSSYEVMAEHDLWVYANLTPISPDGTKVVFNDDSDKLWLLDLKTSKKILLTSGEEGWFGPVWSPEGKRILCSSTTGNLAMIEISSLSLVKIGRGRGYSWSPNGRNIIFSRYFGEIGKEITGSDIFMASADGKTTKKLSASPSEFLMEPSLSLSGELVFFSEKTGKLQKTEPISNEIVEILIDGSRVKDAPASSTGHDTPRTEDQPPDTCISGVPYLHQVYDTPNWFNGNWACNATAAMMCIAYYDILPWWDCTVSVPWSHMSHYGNYVCEIYSFNGHTYDIASPDLNSNDAWGGYGYIVRNNWADTKGYMRDYFANHTMDYNGVDWSPTWEEYLSEIANIYPTVFLSLITESGHYTVGIGCVTGWHTAIFNDPYGDKNTDPYKDYYGEHVYYDWPGYNNGYENLNTMGCFIYARHDPSSPVIDSVTDPSPCEQSGVQINFTDGKAANRHDLYKDNSLAVQSYSSGAVYDPGDTASHTYTVRAVNVGAGRFTDSTGINGADADVTPGEVASFTNLCSWDPVPGANGYKVYRGTFANLPNLLTSSIDGCVRYQDAANGFDCSSDDPVNETDKLYWYLVTALTGTCEGTAGNATGGPRFVDANGICE